MIPKIIHFCWFGGKTKPKTVLNYIHTWRQVCPDYEIMEWNENNFDIEVFPFTNEAYLAGKYAFVADVVRLYALKKYGGIYLDTDVEVLKSFDKFLNCSSFVSFESYDRVGTAVIGAEKESKFVEDCLFYYNGRHFVKEGRYDVTPNTLIISEMLSTKGLIFNNSAQIFSEYLQVFPRTYFSAKIYETGQLEISDNTVAVHNFLSSWVPWYKKIYMSIKRLWNSCNVNAN